LTDFSDLGLSQTILAALTAEGYSKPTPIQCQAIPPVLSGRDLCGIAQTGTGKTAAFALPILQLLAATPRRPAPQTCRTLVLSPTRELASQIADSFRAYGAGQPLSTAVVFGGVPIGRQRQQLARGVDILVATPGRLVDLIERRSCNLRDVEVTVLDEADHMADLGFLPVVRQLLDQTPQSGQRLLFSATLDGDVATLVDNYLSDPAVHALSSAEASIDTMSHHVFRVPFEAKFDLVASIAAREGRTICFVRTKHGADRIARNLGRAGVGAGALHGGRTQAQRNKALAAFRDGSVPVLVATDVAARGIHVDDVSLVLHVDPPQDGKDYLHRSGRTARAGESGVVVLLTTPAEERAVRKMLAEAGVHPEQRDAVAGDPKVAAVTGARQPSGIPVAEPRPTRNNPARAHHGTPRVEHGATGERVRHGSPRPARRPSAAASPRHPQHAERRPRRARSY
jgi:superfamily II DNA/RNA helicase